MTETGICDWCERSFAKPVWKGQQCVGKHAKPTLAQRIVMEIERDLSDRRGLRHEWDVIDAEIQEEIRDTWAEIIEKELKNENQNTG